MSKSPSRLAAVLLGLVLSATGRAEPAVVGLARSYLGPESTINAIQTIHFTGTVDRVNSAQPAVTDHLALDMVFGKPMRQRLRASNDKLTQTTVLDGYDAWDWLVLKSDPAHPRLKWLAAGEVQALRASTWENLYYYHQPDNGSVEDKGPATIDGVECEEVDFGHGGGAVYQRYFDRDTGRLVLTVRGNDSFRESGEIKVNGVHFPKTIVSVTQLPGGKVVTATAVFATVTLNEPLPEGDFTLPSLTGPAPSAAPAPGAQK